MVLVATAFPWAALAAESLWGQVSMPPAARTSAGFSCVLIALLTALLLLSEGRSHEARQAVRSACLLLMALALAMLGFRLLCGPEPIRGVTARHTAWFFVAVAATGLGVAAARGRLQAEERDRG